ncbi:hypothetical protein NQZ68_026762 [Dissostichus eleginoides]|nr:hypothetical protein NQZ68_026762 [Dissostichus eleginoides]
MHEGSPSARRVWENGKSEHQDREDEKADKRSQIICSEGGIESNVFRSCSYTPQMPSSSTSVDGKQGSNLPSCQLYG